MGTKKGFGELQPHINRGSIRIDKSRELPKVDAIFGSLVDNGKWKEASSHYRLIIRRTGLRGIDSRSALKDLVYQGRDYMAGKEFNAAASTYCKALALDSANLDCLKDLARIDLHAGRLEQAEALIDKALSIRGDVPSLWAVKIAISSISGKNLGCLYSILDMAVSKTQMSEDTLIRDILFLTEERDIDKMIEFAVNIWKRDFANRKQRGFLELLALRKYACFEIERASSLSEILELIDTEAVTSVSLSLYALTGTIDENHMLCRAMKKAASLLQEEANRTPLAEPLTDDRSRGKIRIGFVSGDFYDHVVARFFMPLLENLDRNLFDIYCYSTLRQKEDMTRSKIRHMSEFVEIDAHDLRSGARRIRQDRLDICVDLAGYTAGTGIAMFAWRIGRIQISMIGHPGSTFLPEMDYILVDKIMRPEIRDFTSESLLEMDGLAHCMQRPDDSVTVSLETPEERYGFINFGVLINPYKVTTSAIACWSEILRQVRGSQISIVRPEAGSQLFQENILREFERHGITSRQILMVNNKGRGISFTACYDQIDIVLDTFPMTGGTSTFDAILMGLPVVTVTGANFHQRISTSILYHSGMADCIASTIDKYIEIAIGLAKNPKRRKELRLNAMNLRSMQNGPCDGPAYAKRFTASILHALNRPHKQAGLTS